MHLRYVCTLTCTSSTSVTSCLFWARLQNTDPPKMITGAILPSFLPDPSSLAAPHLAGQTCPWLHLPHWPRPHTSPCTSLTPLHLPHTAWLGRSWSCCCCWSFPRGRQGWRELQARPSRQGAHSHVLALPSCSQSCSLKGRGSSTDGWCQPLAAIRKCYSDTCSCWLDSLHLLLELE